MMPSIQPVQPESMRWERLIDHPAGVIVAVTYAGRYLPGSEGNAFASRMVAFLRTVVAESRPAAVVIDLTALDYVFGDAICGLAVPLLSRDHRFLPAAIVAVGKTAIALTPLLTPPMALGVAGVTLFSNQADAVAHLEQFLYQRQWYAGRLAGEKAMPSSGLARVVVSIPGRHYSRHGCVHAVGRDHAAPPSLIVVQHSDDELKRVMSTK
jgi:hypothetical protein